MTQNEKNV